MYKWMSILFMLLTALGVCYAVFSSWTKKASLPVVGPPQHVAANFSFTNENGNTFTNQDVAGKVTVVEYFFTSCPGICRVMNTQLQRVYKVYQNEPQFAILSHTVDPETDEPSVLRAYAERIHAYGKNWHFLTGDKEALYTMARQSYLLSVEDPPTAIEDDFIHTEYVSLLDRDRRIRGFYNATDSTSVQKLINDIAILIKE